MNPKSYLSLFVAEEILRNEYKNPNKASRMRPYQGKRGELEEIPWRYLNVTILKWEIIYPLKFISELSFY